MKRFGYIFLCAVPFLNFVIIGVRALRVPVGCQIAGAIYFAAIALAAWSLGARAAVFGRAERERTLAVAGVLLLAPSALMALLWVGLGPPWQATATENRMRYLVLLFDSIVVTAGFVALKEALHEATVRLYPSVANALAMLAGMAYVVWNCLFLGLYVLKSRGVPTPASFVSLSDSIDALLFTACILTYLAALIFAGCMGRAKWFGRGATRVYIVANGILLGLILIRGLSYPDPTGNGTPWYLNLGFIAGIPAVPWIIPYLYGVTLLRRAGEDAVRKNET